MVQSPVGDQSWSCRSYVAVTGIRPDCADGHAMADGAFAAVRTAIIPGETAATVPWSDTAPSAITALAERRDEM